MQHKGNKQTASSQEGKKPGNAKARKIDFLTNQWVNASTEINNLKSLAEKYRLEAEQWKTLCTKQSQDIDTLKDESAKARRDADDWRRNGDTWRDLYYSVKDRLYKIEHPDAPASPDEDLTKLYAEYKQIIGSPATETQGKGRRKKSKSSPIQVVHLICIKEDADGVLDLYSRYTSPGLTNKNGLLHLHYYPINELDGQIFSPNCFCISESSHS